MPRGLAPPLHPGRAHPADRGDVPRLPRRRRRHRLLRTPARARRDASPSTRSTTCTATAGTSSSTSEQAKRGVAWEPDLTEADAFQIGLDALAVTFAELVPRLGRPVAVQRKLEFAIAPELEWTVQCYLDLETIRDTDTANRRPRSSTTRSRAARSRRPRPTSTRRPACTSPDAGSRASRRGRSRFAQIAKPGARRKQISSALVTTTRTVGQQRATLARIAQAASQIHALYERYGPDEPWGFADPTSWKCSERYCQHWRARARAAPGSDHRSDRAPAAPTDHLPDRGAAQGALRAPARYLATKGSRHARPRAPNPTEGHDPHAHPFAAIYDAGLTAPAAAARSKPASSAGSPTTNAATAASRRPHRPCGCWPEERATVIACPPDRPRAGATARPRDRRRPPATPMFCPARPVASADRTNPEGSTPRCVTSPPPSCRAT